MRQPSQSWCESRGLYRRAWSPREVQRRRVSRKGRERRVSIWHSKFSVDKYFNIFFLFRQFNTEKLVKVYAKRTSLFAHDKTRRNIKCQITRWRNSSDFNLERAVASVFVTSWAESAEAGKSVDNRLCSSLRNMSLIRSQPRYALPSASKFIIDIGFQNFLWKIRKGNN